jgi:hypothetical protein
MQNYHIVKYIYFNCILAPSMLYPNPNYQPRFHIPTLVVVLQTITLYATTTTINYYHHYYYYPLNWPHFSSLNMT